jgi:hypothetical protein
MNCLNLRDLFGHMYRVTFDPAYDPKYKRQDGLDPWMMQIPCRFGTIYPQGGTKLAVEIDGHNRIAHKVIGTGVAKLMQDGDREKTLVFDLTDFDVVAPIVQPRRRRHLSEENIARLVAMGAPHRFSCGVQSDFREQGDEELRQNDPQKAA